ncbi:autoinducer binding domain-containing protein [Celeribacter sp.]|uniref:helix-turn-helix transcriptional regulator n=1 Tax=Celeribacter sp. TaxID=1890673 RepID=UPI003A94419E
MNNSFAIETLRKITASQTVECVWRALHQAIEAAGFGQALYALTRFRTDKSMGESMGHLILSSYPAEYMHAFIGPRERYRIAPMAQWALDNVGTQSWDYVETIRNSLSSEQLELIEFNAKYGLNAGITIGFPSSRRHEKGGIGLALAPHSGTQADANALWAKYGEVLETICHVAHLKFQTLPMPVRVLSPRQREVLEWVGEGKSTADVAEILGVTIATVDKHLRNAREALNVETTAQAVLRASVYNQIYAEA